MSKLTQTAPQQLWLCVSDDAGDNDNPFPSDLSEVTWAVDHCPVAAGVRYVRADTLAELAARRVAKAAEEYQSKSGPLGPNNPRFAAADSELVQAIAAWKKIK